MKKKKSKTPEYPQVVETFSRYIDVHRQDEPSCFNGTVAVRKYRVTVELINEPNEVIAQRIRKLWRECDNHHHWQPLMQAAERVGITLSSDERGTEAGQCSF